MEEDGRSRSTLSSSSIKYPNLMHNQFLPSLKQGFKVDDSPINYTQSWVQNHNQQPRSDGQICQEISRRESIIDKNQDFAQTCRKAIRDLQINGGSAALIASRNNELISYEKKIEESESILISIGPCPVMSCSKHHEASKDDVMDLETGQYVDQNSEFKVVSPKKAAKNLPNLTKSPILTANKFHELANLEENKPEIPAINLKIDSTYNLTLQEIHSNFPETENKLIKGFISIQANSPENRIKIIELLKRNNKEFVLSEAREDRPLKIVIKWLPIDQDKEELREILESNGFKILRISQLRNFREKTLYPYFLVDVVKTENCLNIYNLKTIKHLRIKVEPYRKKNRVTICYKCSNFHHSARNCECKPRCIKCAGSHETRDCDIKNKIENPTCINCEGEGHLASWRGCPKFPKTNNRPPIPTYAQKLKSNLNKTTNPINQNNPPVTEPINTNQDMRDFQTIAKALKTVKEALNEFPNLLEITLLCQFLHTTSDQDSAHHLWCALIGCPSSLLSGLHPPPDHSTACHQTRRTFLRQALFPINDINYFVDRGYFRTYVHCASYCVGLTVGYILATKQKLHIPLRLNVIGWMTSFAAAIIVLYGVYDWNQGNVPGIIVSTLYTCTNKLIWSLALAWVTVTCMTGNGGNEYVHSIHRVSILIVSQ
ncbi:Nucleic-acid-binding protein from transposon X-element [Araneus ventricosus]|uniref:Nucleic-acid-binding protein from transposon X-element n=1 Tax=Araneus ventricosus TaxID=182803 RepID=A0A4Y2STE6_ARAVE|nr:Nucleic-acid-binding protein from transposon X-element [Araneus ventricosus]GBN91460.1 Nucleic-acid-binding protein from transposon X-element [Araneus ventricosus]